eukprot:gnl/Spiro4/25522_TR12724_c0_g1_i1.p1 gnl/Spiro4/25522_TR12724_c0_g1~~gnl/Spiro4/25522_TR12724_c0_g1_i1.p1  ORF type:complete len:281 (+),score=6.59 gnl/Spiro4/25522_TR12724_c0_g1_i1:55-897(+)
MSNASDRCEGTTHLERPPAATVFCVDYKKLLCDECNVWVHRVLGDHQVMRGCERVERPTAMASLLEVWSAAIREGTFTRDDFSELLELFNESRRFTKRLRDVLYDAASIGPIETTHVQVALMQAPFGNFVWANLDMDERWKHPHGAPMHVPAHMVGLLQEELEWKLLGFHQVPLSKNGIFYFTELEGASRPILKTTRPEAKQDYWPVLEVSWSRSIMTKTGFRSFNLPYWMCLAPLRCCLATETPTFVFPQLWKCGVSYTKMGAPYLSSNRGLCLDMRRG